MPLRPALAACVLVVAAACASTGAAPARVEGGVFVNPAGMTLYTFDKDPSGRSVCNGPCAVNWPPLAVAPDATPPSGDWTIITRDDGSRQWAYKGRPLYTWIKDLKPGDRTGDGFNKVWSLARP